MVPPVHAEPPTAPAPVAEPPKPEQLPVVPATEVAVANAVVVSAPPVPPRERRQGALVLLSRVPRSVGSTGGAETTTALATATSVAGTTGSCSGLGGSATGAGAVGGSACTGGTTGTPSSVGAGRVQGPPLLELVPE